MPERLSRSFYMQDARKAAPLLLGKLLVRRMPDGSVRRLRITETECYCGQEDAACHARAGKTGRTEIMYGPGGFSYVYMIYGIHYLLNVVTGAKNDPQAVLIRAAEGYGGPAKLTKYMHITKEQNGLDLVSSDQLWLEDDGFAVSHRTAPRVGIDYAAEPYKSIPWRFILTT